jgi:hypothetical protein
MFSSCDLYLFMHTDVQHDFHFIWCLRRWKTTGLARCHCRSRWCLCRLKATGLARCNCRSRWCLCRLQATGLTRFHCRNRWCLCRLKATGMVRCHCRSRWWLCRLKATGLTRCRSRNYQPFRSTTLNYCVVRLLVVYFRYSKCKSGKTIITLFISGCVVIFNFQFILNEQNYKNSFKINIIVLSYTCITSSFLAF